MASTDEADFDFEEWAKGKMGRRPPFRERLMAAVDAMATSRRDISARLGFAYLLMGLDGEKELPENLRDDYRWISERISKRKAFAGGASVIAVAKTIRGKQAQRVATAIVRLHRRMEAQSKTPLVSNLP